MATSVPSGVSHHGMATPFIVIRRAFLNHKGPVKIESEQATLNGDVWLGHRRFPFIHKMQLRKEREAPFFHEYIVFSLHEDSGYFRIDRRPQRSLMECTRQGGVEAEDTIEQVTSFEDILFGFSDLLIEVEFEYFDTSLTSLLRVCRAIRAHPESKSYTLQQYNCYFFAQTIIICMTRMKYGSFSPVAVVSNRTINVTERLIVLRCGGSSQGNAPQLIPSKPSLVRI